MIAFVLTQFTCCQMSVTLDGSIIASKFNMLEQSTTVKDVCNYVWVWDRRGRRKHFPLCLWLFFSLCCFRPWFILRINQQRQYSLSLISTSSLCSHCLQSVPQFSEVSDPAASRAAPHSPGPCAQVPVARHHGRCVHEAHKQRGT